MMIIQPRLRLTDERGVVEALGGNAAQMASRQSALAGLAIIPEAQRAHRRLLMLVQGHPAPGRLNGIDASCGAEIPAA